VNRLPEHEHSPSLWKSAKERWFQLSPRLRVIIALALSIPGLLVFWFSLASYREAGAHLAPKSVSVRGYHRRDGTYVRPYNRRPPGGVAHDAPYEKTQSFCRWGMFLGVMLAISPVALLFLKRKKATLEAPASFFGFFCCSSLPHPRQ
jgi:hypothetical protein